MTREQAKNVIKFLTRFIRLNRENNTKNALKMYFESVELPGERLDKLLEINSVYEALRQVAGITKEDGTLANPIPLSTYSEMNREYFAIENAHYSCCTAFRIFNLAYSLRSGTPYHKVEVPNFTNRLTPQQWKVVITIHDSLEFGDPTPIVVPTREEQDALWKEARGEAFAHWLLSHPNYVFPHNTNIRREDLVVENTADESK